MSDMAGKAAKVAVEPSGSERDTMEAGRESRIRGEVAAYSYARTPDLCRSAASVVNLKRSRRNGLSGFSGSVKEKP